MCVASIRHTHQDLGDFFGWNPGKIKIEILMMLIDVDPGKQVKVTGVRGGHAVASKLRQLGLLPGDRARVMRQAPFGGPILIEISGRTIALGRGVAAKILVEVEQENS